MLFKIFSTLTLKKSTAGTTQPPDPQPKPAQPAATRKKKPSTFGRVLKALKSSCSKTQERQNHYPQVNFRRSCRTRLVLLPSHPEPMFFVVFSTFSVKKSTPATTQPTGRQAKPAEPTATPTKKPSVLGRVLKAMKSPLSKIRQRNYPPITPPPLECVYTPTVGYNPFSRYPTFDLDDFPVAAPFLPNSTLAAANLPLPLPSRSPMTTPTTIDSGYLSASTPERSPRPSDDLRRDPQVEACQFAIDRLVEALEAGPQNFQALRNSEVDRIWDAEEAKALAEEEKEEEKAKRRAQRFDLQVKSEHMLSGHDRLIQAGVQAKERRGRGFSSVRDRRADL